MPTPTPIRKPAPRNIELDEAVAKAYVAIRLAHLAKDCAGVLSDFDREKGVPDWALCFAVDAARELFEKFHSDDEVA